MCPAHRSIILKYPIDSRDQPSTSTYDPPLPTQAHTFSHLVGPDERVQRITPCHSRPPPIAKVRMGVPHLIDGQDHGALLAARLQELDNLRCGGAGGVTSEDHGMVRGDE